MAALSFSTNWPTFQQRHQEYNAVVPPPPEFLTLHDNFYTLSDTSINPLESNHHFTSFNNGVTNTNLSFHNSLKYPTLSSSYNSPVTAQQQLLPMTFPDLIDLSSFTHDSYTTPCPYPYPYSPYPLVPDVCPMDDQQLLPELPPLPEIYQGDGGSDPVMIPFQGEERSTGVVHVTKENGNVGGRLSAQSMAARVRRRKISEKTMELGKLVPGGHRMNTAEMFQAAFKYVKFLQAQVGVLQFMDSSPEPEPNRDLVHALVMSRSVQEKLYSAEKCIVTQTFGKSLANDH